MPYERLFTPIRINNLELKNRVIMAPTHDGLTTIDGIVETRTTDFYLKRAKGGVSMIIIGAIAVNPRKAPFLLRISDDKYIPGLTQFTTRIHSETGVVICAQLMEPPRMSQNWMQNINDISSEDITKTISYFVNGAIRAQKAGFDAIELHAAHGYLLAAYLSLINKRDDGYGKTSDGRIRIVRDINEKIRSALGPGYPLGIRINGDEFIIGGNTLSQSRIIAGKLAAIGFDYISVSAGGKHEDSPGVHPKGGSPWPYPPVSGYSGYRSVPTAYMPEAANVYLAADIRRTIRQAGYSTPVIAAGRIPYPELAEAILRDEQADIIGLSRPLLRDPDWVLKAKSGKEKKIKRCTYCNECMDKLIKDEPALCVFLNE
ncbi:MAG: NADH:flavin oxidoreductase [Dehalococcoidia bacterium]|nr:NADH:flavin oxidoreductase [Dehalococcoidia bacterium]